MKAVVVRSASDFCLYQDLRLRIVGRASALRVCSTGCWRGSGSCWSRKLVLTHLERRVRTESLVYSSAWWKFSGLSVLACHSRLFVSLCSTFGTLEFWPVRMRPVCLTRGPTLAHFHAPHLFKRINCCEQLSEKALNLEHSQLEEFGPCRNWCVRFAVADRFSYFVGNICIFFFVLYIRVARSTLEWSKLHTMPSDENQPLLDSPLCPTNYGPPGDIIVGTSQPVEPVAVKGKGENQPMSDASVEILFEEDPEEMKIGVRKRTMRCVPEFCCLFTLGFSIISFVTPSDCLYFLSFSLQW